MTRVAANSDRETEAIKRRLHDLEGRVRDARERHGTGPKEAEAGGRRWGRRSSFRPR